MIDLVLHFYAKIGIIIKIIINIHILFGKDAPEKLIQQNNLYGKPCNSNLL